MQLYVRVAMFSARRVRFHADCRRVAASARVIVTLGQVQLQFKNGARASSTGVSANREPSEKQWWQPGSTFLPGPRVTSTVGVPPLPDAADLDVNRGSSSYVSRKWTHFAAAQCVPLWVADMVSVLLKSCALLPIVCMLWASGWVG